MTEEEIPDDFSDVTFTQEQEDWFKDIGEHYRHINTRVFELDQKTGEQYISLRTRAGRLVRLIELRAPKIIIDKECELVIRALDAIDPRWREKMPEGPEL